MPCVQAGQISERTDVYSYGVLLWELLTGREAWEECVSPMQIIFAVAVERRRPAIPSGCPPAIARLLKECWRHNAPLRPSFAEIVSRLSKMRSQSMLLQLQPAVRNTQPASLAFKGPAISPYSKAGAPGRPLKPHVIAH
jgi:serine/threonine protein kinase